MRLEKSAGAIIYTEEGGKIFFLLLHYPAMTHRSGKDYWDFVKGHVEEGESKMETVRREAFEETGLDDLDFKAGFCERMEYFFSHNGEKIFKIADFLLAATKTRQITLSDEHNDFVWLPYREAQARLSFENAKKIFQKANSFLAANTG